MLIIGLSGSLRRGSYNTALLRAAGEVAPPGVELEVVTPHGIPLYDGDVEAEQGVPPSVEALKDRIETADGLILATPEYNQSVPGVLKNAMDWLTRPPKDVSRVFRGLPVAVMGATPGVNGTIMAQAAWLPVLNALRVRLFTGRVMRVRHASSVFDAEHRLTDEPVRDQLKQFMAAFAAFAGE